MSTNKTLNKEILAGVISASEDVNPVKVLAKALKANKSKLVVRLLELDDIESKASAERVMKVLFEAVADLDQEASKATGSRVLDLTIATIKDSLIAGDDVTLSGFVNMKPAIQAPKPERDGRNPKTGEAMRLPAIPAKNVVRTSVTAPFKRELNA